MSGPHFTESTDYLVLEIWQDELDTDGSRDWSNLGTMVCFHGRYPLGDKNHYDLPEGVVFFEGEYEEIYGIGTFKDVIWAKMFEEELEKRGGIVLPLYLYDHSGITMRTTPYDCPWDSGRIGFIYCTKERIIKEYGNDSKESREKAEKVLVGEVETYDQELTGDVWCYHIVSQNEDDNDSLHGLYGYDYALETGREAVAEILNKHATGLAARSDD